MISININRDQEGNIISFSGQGHAEYAEYGTDIVCAAVSAIMQTAAIGLDNHLNLNFDIEINDGWLSCQLTSELAQQKEVRAILETMFLGLKSTEESYQKYLKVIEGGGKND